MVSVILEAAIGAMTLARMLYLKPSFARVSVKPTCASLAAVERSVCHPRANDKTVPE